MKRLLLLGLLALARCASNSNELPHRLAVDDPTEPMAPESPMPRLSDVLAIPDGGAR
jgi:hypothetical protein